MSKLAADIGPSMGINKYHNAMFTGEVIHSGWIDECAQYLKSIFGDEIEGKRVIDYGFGRGNWSLAFQNLGAKSVISIDASESAADGFQHYIDAHNIDNVSVLVGNIDEEDIELEADIVFLYGIFHHVKYPDKLLQSAANWLATPQGTILVYAYDGGCMREIVVSACRKLVINSRQDNGWEHMLHPNARHRAVDDLVAPTVTFWQLENLLDVLNCAGLDCVNQVKDFSNFQDKSLAPEFDPYVLLAKLNTAGSKKFEATANAHVYADEYKILEEAIQLVRRYADEEKKQQYAIGLFNTWFPAAGQVSFEEQIFYLWRYVCHAIISIPAIVDQNVTSLRLQVLINLTRRIQHENTEEFENNCRMLKKLIRNRSFRI